MDKFLKIIANFGVILSDDKKQLLLDTFPGRFEGDRPRINIGKLYEVRYNDKLKKIYYKIQMGETDDDDVAIDASGYTGNFHRQQNDKNLLLYSMDELA